MGRYDARDSKTLHGAWAALGDTQGLGEFLAGIDDLDPEQKALIVDQALVMLTGLYAHLPLKEARHAVNPEQRLRLLQQRIGVGGDTAFHREMIEIFKQLRDAHTNYGLPRPYSGRLAFLPFLMEDYFEDGARKYLVTRLLFGFSHSRFKAGVEITHWNGTPVDRAVRMNAEREEGSNLPARLAFGLAAMTVRGLGSSLPPDEEWVIVTFRSGDQTHEIILPWRVWDRATETTPDLSAAHADASGSNAATTSLCARVRESHTARKHLFARAAVTACDRIAPATEAVEAAALALGTDDLSGIELLGVDLATESVLPDVFQFRVHQHGGRELGYIRIRSFAHGDVGQFVNEFLRILRLMPGDGLVLDVRGNGGGVILNGELLLQLFTPKKIEPEPTQFICTPLTLALCSEPTSGFDQAAADRLGIPLETLQGIAQLRRELAATWGESIAQSVQTGAVYSKSAPITDPDLANVLGQRYHGPVALITDAQCYSTTDIFAAGFQDHGIGPIIGVDANTGAGGANVFEHRRLLVPLLHEAGSPVQPLPEGTTMRVAIRRTLRVGRNAGQPLEDLGVRPDLPHDMTRDDLLADNVDLIARANEVLTGMAVRRLDLALNSLQDDVLNLTATTRGVTRLDFYVNGRPMSTSDVADGDSVHAVRARALPFTLAVEGYAGDELVAGRKLQLQP